ncbi:MAG: AsmA family protein, partial [Gammaproteobacteria bacterium]|nr:AsmA family protein [Gammaproteobacteria bacterium]
MKILKRLFVGLVGLVVLLVVVVVVAANVLDPNDHKNFIENKTQSLIGRDLSITGDIKLSYFPWVGIKLGEIELANAEGFEDKPFAKIDHANVKVELLPLLRKVVNAKTVELAGLTVNLHRAADGTTNWDDLANREPVTTSTTEDNTTTEVEGEPAAIAALAVGGLDIADALINWQDDQSGTDATLSNFDLTTGAIELAKPFDLNTSFELNSNSLGLAAKVKSGGNVNLDLAEQRYALNGLTFETNATGDMLPAGKLDLSMATSILADLTAQTVDATDLTVNILGLTLAGNIAVEQLDAEPQIAATLASENFSPREVMKQLGIEAPVTADEKVLSAASVSMAVAASPAAAKLKDLTITLDDTTFKGSARLPNLAAAMPPVRFDFGVDKIDLDRYLPPGSDAPVEESATTETAATEDTPIELPMELLRQLNVKGVFSVGELKIMNLTTRDIAVPLNAKGGVIALEDVAAKLYDGTLASTITLNAKADTPVYSVNTALTKVESDPLLADLRQADSPLSGNANFNAALETAGNSVNGLKAGLNGTFDAAFLDGSINGINIGYQLRRAKATIKGQSLSEDEKQVKTDFSSLSVSGVFKDG